MKKKTVILTENQLRNIIKETINEALNELTPYSNMQNSVFNTNAPQNQSGWGKFKSKLARTFMPNTAKRYDATMNDYAQKTSNLANEKGQQLAADNTIPSYRYVSGSEYVPAKHIRGGRSKQAYTKYSYEYGKDYINYLKQNGVQVQPGTSMEQLQQMAQNLENKKVNGIRDKFNIYNGISQKYGGKTASLEYHNVNDTTKDGLEQQQQNAIQNGINWQQQGANQQQTVQQN